MGWDGTLGGGGGAVDVRKQSSNSRNADGSGGFMMMMTVMMKRICQNITEAEKKLSPPRFPRVGGTREACRPDCD